MKQRCPDDEILIDYIENRLSEQDRFIVEKHVSNCAMCLEDYVITNSLLAGRVRFELNPSPLEVTEAAVRLVSNQRIFSYGFWVEKIKHIIENWNSRVTGILHLKLWGDRPFATIRGSETVVSEDNACLSVNFNEIKTEIEIEKSGSNQARIRVKLHEPGKHRHAMRLTLKNGDREIASYLLEDSQVLYEDIPSGRYSISLIEDGAQAGIFNFEIKDSLYG